MSKHGKPGILAAASRWLAQWPRWAVRHPLAAVIDVASGTAAGGALSHLVLWPHSWRGSLIVLYAGALANAVLWLCMMGTYRSGAMSPVQEWRSRAGKWHPGRPHGEGTCCHEEWLAGMTWYDRRRVRDAARSVR